MSELNDFEKRDLMEGLSRGLRVIEAFNEARRRLTPSEAAELAGISRAAARRCLLTLASDGYASFDGKFFSLTPKALGLGRAYLAMTPLAAALQPYVQQVCDLFNDPCTAAILDGRDVIYVARATPHRTLTTQLGIGSRLPAHCTSLGRALLAYQDGEFMRWFWDGATLEKRTPATLVDRPSIERALDAVRKRGYALLEEEAEVGLRSLAVPLRNLHHKVVASITLTAPVSARSAEDLVANVLPKLSEIQRTLRHLDL